MSKRARSPRLELRMNVSPPRESTSASSDVSLEFSTSSSISIQSFESVSSVVEETKAMLLVGCPRCLIYVMLSEVDPKCPKCKSTVLLDFLNDQEKNKKTF